ncbi:hypothetical protein CCR75_006997 [Bremia lactucae]|uniref:RxLR effector protein n=1 Tax=Bremia lactucae TaxID=4779 RepID=A0A976IH78_BRELC|nr:hypothetical protein CCR75_006997 [Bremia lactucae]
MRLGLLFTIVFTTSLAMPTNALAVSDDVYKDRALTFDSPLTEEREHEDDDSTEPAKPVVHHPKKKRKGFFAKLVEKLKL